VPFGLGWVIEPIIQKREYVVCATTFENITAAALWLRRALRAAAK
jgi:hypothetical protein